MRARLLVLSALVSMGALSLAATASVASAPASAGSSTVRIRDCFKHKRATTAKRRLCKHRAHRLRKANSPLENQPQGKPATTTQGATPNPGDNGQPSGPSPEDQKSSDDSPPAPPEPNCEIVEGPCEIYTGKFWELQAKYERFEGTWASYAGVYPAPPECMEAQEKAAQEGSEAIGCPAVIAYLYPDGTTGSDAWSIESCAPKGWRRSGEPTPPSCVKASPRCELVQGDCSIYSQKFWDLLAKYARFDSGIGDYPEPPECMEAAESNPNVACPQMAYSLYPDGTLGGAPWVVDPCVVPKGWRFWDEPSPPCE